MSMFRRKNSLQIGNSGTRLGDNCWSVVFSCPTGMPHLPSALKGSQTITHRFKLDQVNEALATVASGKTGKAVILPNGE